MNASRGALAAIAALVAVFAAVGAGLLLFPRFQPIPGVAPERASCSVLRETGFGSVIEQLWFFVHCGHPESPDLLIGLALVGVVLCVVAAGFLMYREISPAGTGSRAGSADEDRQ